MFTLKYLLVSQCWCSPQISSPNKKLPCFLQKLHCFFPSPFSPPSFPIRMHKLKWFVSLILWIFWTSPSSSLAEMWSGLKLWVCVYQCKCWQGWPQSLAEPLEWFPSIFMVLAVRLETLHTFRHRAYSRAAGTVLSKIHSIFKVSVPSVSLWYLFLKQAVKLLCFFRFRSLIQTLTHFIT